MDRPTGREPLMKLLHGCRSGDECCQQEHKDFIRAQRRRRGQRKVKILQEWDLDWQIRNKDDPIVLAAGGHDAELPPENEEDDIPLWWPRTERLYGMARISLDLALCRFLCYDTRPNIYKNLESFLTPVEFPILNVRVEETVRALGEPTEYLTDATEWLPHDEVKYRGIYWMYCPPGQIAGEVEKDWWLQPVEKLQEPRKRSDCRCYGKPLVRVTAFPTYIRARHDDCIETPIAEDDGRMMIWLRPGAWAEKTMPAERASPPSTEADAESSTQAGPKTMTVRLYDKQKSQLLQLSNDGHLLTSRDLERGDRLSICVDNNQDVDIDVELRASFKNASDDV